MTADATSPAGTNLGKLQSFLRELFQFDLADLDFGIYRLLNLKRGEVEAFLTTDLPARVETAFKQAAGADHAEAQRRIEQLAERVRADIDADAIAETGDIRAAFRDQKAKATRALLTEYESAREQLRQSQASEEDKAEVFQHVLTFFSRYYDGGDFIPRCQRTRANYAVPWTGEETLFHWANKGQHYVKTGETFRDYSFTVAGIAGEYRIRFVLSDADLPLGNTKGDTRYFFPLPRQIAYDESTRTLRVPFHYRLPTAEETAKHGKANRIQDAILDEILPRILKATPDAFLQEALAAKDGPAPENGDKDNRPTLLHRRLRHFCKKNTTDYFITPHLAEFLTAELDYYLKDQVINIHDLDGDFERKRRILRVIRALAADIIRFLAQIEDVQNRLFEKRKFVLRTDYLVTLKAVPREFWKEIVANKAQLEEWKRLFAIEPRQDLLNRAGKVNEDFLTEHPTLVVNTALFDAGFTARLLATFDDLEGVTDGILIHSENYQAIRFLQPIYSGNVECIHVDPPYNTDTSGFLYKNNYKHSSWLAMMEARVHASLTLLTNSGSYLCHIDENEYEVLHNLFQRTGIPNAGPIIWDKRNPMPAGRGVATQHEYIIWRSAKEAPIYLRNTNAAKMLTVAREIVKRNGGVTEQAQKEYSRWVRNNSDLSGGEKAYCFLDVQGRPFQSVSLRAPEPRTDPKFHTPLIHPVTGNPCPVPPNGFSRTPETLQGMIRAGDILFGRDETTQPRQKVPLTEETQKQMSSLIQDARKGKADLDALGLGFPYCHPVSLYETLVGAATTGGTVLDHFGGSGTSAHAVINLNREDGGRRKFILVEIGAYFDTVLLPRIQKVMFTPEWKEGKPTRHPTKAEAERTPRLLKVLRLESYEDALHNLTTDATKTGEAKRSKAVAKRIGAPEHRLSYLLRLPLETNVSLLNVAALEHPFDYTLETLTENGPQVQRVDVVETFNWLYGLRVHRMRTWVHPGGTTSVSSANGKRKTDATERVHPTGTRTYRVVEATRGRDTRVLVVWRDMADLEPAVERAFIAAQLKTAGDFDERWINGDCSVPGLDSLDGLFKRLVDGGAA